jgi:hypothetical protein
MLKISKQLTRKLAFLSLITLFSVVTFAMSGCGKNDTAATTSTNKLSVPAAQMKCNGESCI